MRRPFFFLSLSFLFCSGCAYLKPVSVSTTSFNPEHEISLGPVDARVVNEYFFGFLSGSEETLRTAMEDAKRKADADNLINVTVDRRVTYYPFPILPLVVHDETNIHATAIRYKDRSAIQQAPASFPPPTSK